MHIYEDELKVSGNVVSSFNKLNYQPIEVGDNKKFRIGSPLQILNLDDEKGFALGIEIPKQSSKIEFRSIFSSSNANTAHVVYPDIYFLNSNKKILKKVSPYMVSVHDMSWDSVYFLGSEEIPESSIYFVAYFSSKHFEGSLHYRESATFSPVVTQNINREMPIGPGGPFRVLFD